MHHINLLPLLNSVKKAILLEKWPILTLKKLFKSFHVILYKYVKQVGESEFRVGEVVRPRFVAHFLLLLSFAHISIKS